MAAQLVDQVNVDLPGLKLLGVEVGAVPPDRGCRALQAEWPTLEGTVYEAQKCS